MLSIFKGIKKVKKILFYVLSAVVFLLLFLNLLINFPAVQTWACKRIAGYYSNKLHAKVEIGHVNFEFLKKLVLHKVYIQDQHSDTLLYADALKFDVGAIHFKEHILYLSNIEIKQTKLHLITYKNTHELNLQFIIDAFASKDTTPGPKWNISFGSLTLNNVDFRLQNQNDTDSVQGMNYANLKVHNIYSKISDIEFVGDTLRATIEKLSADEQCGFVLKNMSCYVKLSSHGMELDALKIETPQTNLATDLIFRYNAFTDFNDFVNKVDMHAVFRRSRVCFQDVAYFASGLNGVHNCFTISGKYTGTVSHLRGEDMDIGWGIFSSLRGNASMDGLPDIDKTRIKVNVSDLVTSKTDIEILPKPPFDKEQHIELPANIGYLKTIHISGNFDGYISDFNASGLLVTDIGTIASSLNLRQDTVAHKAYYKGFLQTQAFNIGRFLQLKDMGTITSSVNIQGNGLRKNDADAVINGSLQSLTYKRYTYHNTTLNGEFRKGFFSGIVAANDPNVHLNFNGEVDITSKVHRFTFDSKIDGINLSAIHLVSDSTSPAILAGHVKVDVKGNSLNDMTGTVDMDSTSYNVHKGSYHINYLTLKSAINGGTHTINMVSDYADVNVSGHFLPLQSADDFQNMMAYYIPDRYTKEKRATGDRDYHDYTYNIKFKENTGLTDLFIPALKIAPGTVIKGHYNESGNELALTGQAPLLEWNGRKMKNWNINMSGNKSELDVKTACDTLNISDSIYAAGFNVKGSIANDTVNYTVAWNNDSSNYAHIPGSITFSQKVQTAFRLIDPVINISDSAWQVSKDNALVFDTSGISARNIMFYHNQQYIAAAGKLSSKKSDALVINFHQFNIDNLVFTAPALQGTVDGTASVSNAYNHPFFVSALNFSNLYLNKEYIGNATINSYWDNDSRSIATNGQIISHDVKSFSFIGNYYPTRDTENINIDANFHGFMIKTFQPYAKDYCSVLDGSMSGNVHVSGSLNKPVLHGNIIADVQNVKVDYLNTYYNIPELDIKVAPDTFMVRPSRLYDQYGDTAIASGNLYHHNFKNFRLDFGISTNNFFCLDTKEELNSLYYGQGFVSGNVSIYGYLNNIHLDANITTQKGTVFKIPLSNASEVEQSDYIHFVTKGAAKNKKKEGYKVNLNGLQMDFDVHVTPDAEAQLIFASKVGDMLTSTGYGNMHLGINTFGDFSIRGNYTVVDGNYRFVLQNIINKDFKLQQGGTIQWNGDPYNAVIDVNTVHTVRTSLSPLFPFDSTSTYKKIIPVNCDLALSGKLTSPDIRFNIDLPTADEYTRQTVASYLANPDELNRQVFSLLIISSFLPVQEGANVATAPAAQAIPGSAGYAALTSQLNNLLSSLSNKVNIGVNYNPGTSFSPQEAQVLLSTELLGGRVLINTDMATVGATTTGAQTENSNNVVGEVTVEYKVSKDGKLRVKAFNKANDNTSINLLNSQYTQGVGVSYREGFTTFGELWDKFKSKFHRNPKKEKAASSN